MQDWERRAYKLGAIWGVAIGASLGLIFFLVVHSFRRDIRRLNALIEELEERMADPDEGLQLKPEIEKKLIRTSKSSRDSLISAPDMRKKLGL